MLRIGEYFSAEREDDSREVEGAGESPESSRVLEVDSHRYFHMTCVGTIQWLRDWRATWSSVVASCKMNFTASFATSTIAGRSFCISRKQSAESSRSLLSY